MKILQEFKEFASRGNLVDMSVAFVMGGAFGKIVSAFTEGLIAPLITLITGGVDFSKKELVLRKPVQEMNDAGEMISKVEPVTLKYGALITSVIDFLIVALAMFILVKAINRMRKAKEAAPSEPSSTDKLLMEIRDALRK